MKEARDTRPEAKINEHSPKVEKKSNKKKKSGSLTAKNKT